MHFLSLIIMILKIGLQPAMHNFFFFQTKKINKSKSDYFSESERFSREMYFWT